MKYTEHSSLDMMCFSMVFVYGSEDLHGIRSGIS
jgi:hypothetical protein